MITDRRPSRERIAELMDRERASFARTHPRSRELYERSGASLLGGVPMSWMMKWAGGFPMFADHAQGSTVIDVDGNEYADFCLGDTGAMTGHAPPPVAETVAEQARRAITTMLPSSDAPAVGEALAERFGLPLWQITLSATDANRFAIRMARDITQRPRILVFNWCYHGTVDETFAVLHEGRVVSRPGNIGAPVELDRTTRVVEFNDVGALEEALSQGDVACVLAEPAMTNIGIVPAEPGYHEALRELTRRHGTILIIDETHTISTGYGGYTREYGLEPDMLTVGKTIGGGVPAGAFGLSHETARRAFERPEADYVDTGGVGGTLAGNALSIAAMRRDPRRRADRGGVRPHRSPGRAFRGGNPRRHRARRGPVERRETRLARRVWLLARAAAYRGRGSGLPRRRARDAAAPLRPQPRGAHDPVPQHGSHGADDDGGAGGPAHDGILRGAG